MIEAQLTRLGGVSGDALVVVSVESLKGERIEDYAFTLFNTWGIGDAATDRGLLVLVAPNERKVRIEVGCGLESTISDDLAADIIQKRMLPEFRQGDFAAGVQAGVDALIERMELPQPANDPGPHSVLCTADMRNAA